MPATASYQIYGIQEALAELNKIDKKLRRDVTTKIQGGAGTMLVQAARNLVPAKPPLSRMVNGNMIKGREGTGWSRDRVLAGIRTIVGKRGSRARTTTFSNGTTVDFKATQYQLLVLQQKDVAGAIWDHSGLHGRSQFITNLQTAGQHVGPAQAPRDLTPAALSVLPEVEREVELIVKDVMAQVSRNLITVKGR
jgi:hypothetical protein